jgi:hypothetical protein
LLCDSVMTDMLTEGCRQGRRVLFICLLMSGAALPPELVAMIIQHYHTERQLSHDIF